jgi:hypothetical protein
MHRLDAAKIRQPQTSVAELRQFTGSLDVTRAANGCGRTEGYFFLLLSLLWSAGWVKSRPN